MLKILLWLFYVIILMEPDFFLRNWPVSTMIAYAIPAAYILWCILRSDWLEKHNYRAYISGKDRHYWMIQRSSLLRFRDLVAKARKSSH